MVLLISLYTDTATPIQICNSEKKIEKIYAFNFAIVWWNSYMYMYMYTVLIYFSKNKEYNFVLYILKQKSCSNNV